MSRSRERNAESQMVVGFPKRMEETGTQVIYKSGGKEGGKQRNRDGEDMKEAMVIKDRDGNVLTYARGVMEDGKSTLSS